ncbi:MAG: class I SAM-dependent methyltransferase [Candidatus Neomarinimicrobiota bacterium]
MIEQLKDYQLNTFDTEYVDEQKWPVIKRCIDRDFPDGQFSFLDIGGGNGLFADRILTNYPQSHGTMLDNSALLINKNKPHDRKRVIVNSVENIGTGNNEKYDLIFLNWLLHHLVDNTYRLTRQNIDGILLTIRSLLADRGRVSIFENMYNGLIFDRAPGWLVYQLTSQKLIAPIVAKAGANTAGVGVCFLSEKQWHSCIQGNGFEILDYYRDDVWEIPWTWNLFLHISKIYCGHFWLRI